MWGGVSDHDKAYIAIRVQATETGQRGEPSMRITLLHEVTHCVYRYVGMDHMLRHWMPKADDREEAIIEMTSGPMLAVLRENPTLVAYLLGGE